MTDDVKVLESELAGHVVAVGASPGAALVGPSEQGLAVLDA